MIAVLVLVSTFSALHATLMTGSRVLFALADRGLLFRIVKESIAQVPESLRRGLDFDWARDFLRSAKRLRAVDRSRHTGTVALLYAHRGSRVCAAAQAPGSA